MVTTDFPNLLSNTAETTAQKALSALKHMKPGATCRVMVSDPRWKTSGAFGKIDLRKSRKDRKQVCILHRERGQRFDLKYAKKVQFTEEMMINDRWGQFMKVLDEFGLSARALEGDILHGILCDNPDAADGTELFHADHKNLAGTAAVPTEASLSAAFVAMATQLDVDGKPYPHHPNFCHCALLPFACHQQGSVFADLR